MTQATQPAPQPAAPAAAPAARAAAAPARATTRDVPALLNRWQVIAVSVCLLFAVATAVLQTLAWHANRAAADNTEQLVRVQNIQSSLLRADSLATSAFLIGGLEPPAQRAAYDQAVVDVTRRIVQAAEAQPADRAALAALNEAVAAYATTNTQARDNNRQGFPVGSAYLGTASAGLRADALPLVTALVAANSDRAEDEMGAQRPYLVILPGLLALGVLLWVNRQLAATFRRRFNVGLLAAFVGIGVVTLVSVVVSSVQLGANATLRDGSYAAAVDGATARSAGNDARANEALRLINRGSGAAFEDAYAEARAVVESTAGPAVLTLWNAYDGLHQDVVDLDDGGQWDQAVAAATGTESTGAFDAFDTAAQQVVDTQAAATTGDLRSGNAGNLVLAGVSLLVGLAAAGLCTWGIAARRREYA